ncbi:smalltalk protein [Phocaeicola salanitronis]|nr:smalltalk protein [Phocaeicola salanitronis]
MEEKKKNVWSVVLKVIIAVASAVAGALGISACM